MLYYHTMAFKDVEESEEKFIIIRCIDIGIDIYR